jgi:anti-sigma regulatory factor (Ser/Thr protein kinase)
MPTETDFHHEALLYAGQEEFLDGTVAFIRDGLEAGEPTMVMVSAAKIDLLKGELRGDADCVGFADMGEVGANPARIIPAWSDFVGDHGGADRRLRGIGEPIWAARSDAELVECQRHESLLNLASYAGSEAVATPFDDPLPAPLATPDLLFFDGGMLDVLRRFVSGHAADAGILGSRTDDLVLAVDELAANSIQHADGRGALRVWSEPEAFICEIHDAGRIEDPLAGRVRPDPEGLNGRGLWIVNQLCDLVQVRSFDAGSVVRVHMRLDANA